MSDPKNNFESTKSENRAQSGDTVPEGSPSSSTPAGEPNVFDSSYPTLANPGTDFIIRGTVLRTCYSAKSGEVKIPIGVTHIYNDSALSWAFKDCYLITSIIMPDTVVELENGTFCSCKALKKLRLSDKLKEIPSHMCNGCGELEEIHIPEGVSEIGFAAFSDCRGLKKVTLPKSLRTIDANAFCDCIKLESIDIPANVEKIGDRCFCGCSNLTSVTVGKGVTTIGADAFEGCTSLTTVVLPPRFLMRKRLIGIPSSVRVTFKNV